MRIAIAAVLGAVIPLFLIWYSGKDINMLERSVDNVFLLLLVIACGFLGSAGGAMWQLWSDENKELRK